MKPKNLEGKNICGLLVSWKKVWDYKSMVPIDLPYIFMFFLLTNSYHAVSYVATRFKLPLSSSSIIEHLAQDDGTVLLLDDVINCKILNVLFHLMIIKRLSNTDLIILVTI